MSHTSKSVVDHELKTVSPTAIELHEQCPTRWYHRYVRGIKEPETDDQRAGTAMHKRLEDTIKHRAQPTLALRDELPLLGYLPPVPYWNQLDVEKPIRISAGGIEVIGKIDVTNRSGFWIAEGDADPRESPVVEIIDWKRASWRWRKTADQLLTTAMTTYGHAVAPGASVRLSLAYKDKASTKTQKVSRLFSADQIAESFKLKVLDQIPAMEESASALEKDVAKNPDSCYAYNQPCPWIDRCWPGPDRLFITRNRR